MTDSQLYNIFVCTELEYQLHKEELKVEGSAYIAEARRYHEKHWNKVLRVQKHRKEFNCDQYPRHLLSQLTELRKDSTIQTSIGKQ